MDSRLYVTSDGGTTVLKDRPVTYTLSPTRLWFLRARIHNVGIKDPVSGCEGTERMR